jgi:hypothetical protein
MDGPYRLPCHAVPSALTAAAQLRVDGISSCCYIVNVHTTIRHDCSHEGQAGASSHGNSSLVLTTGNLITHGTVSGRHYNNLADFSWIFLTKYYTLSDRAQIFKCLRGPEVDFKILILPSYVVWRAGTTNGVYKFELRFQGRNFNF